MGTAGRVGGRAGVGNAAFAKDCASPLSQANWNRASFLCRRGKGTSTRICSRTSIAGASSCSSLRSRTASCPRESTIRFSGDIDGTDAWLVAFGEGRLTKQPMGGKVRLQGRSAFRGEKRSPLMQRPAVTQAPVSPPFTCEVPKSWTGGECHWADATGQVRSPRRQAGSGDYSQHGGGGSGRQYQSLATWTGIAAQGALDLPPRSKNELIKIQVDGHDATSVVLLGPEEAQQRESILGVIVEAPGSSNGGSSSSKVMRNLSAREMEHFDEFVQSIRFREDKVSTKQCEGASWRT